MISKSETISWAKDFSVLNENATVKQIAKHNTNKIVSKIVLYLETFAIGLLYKC